MSDLSYFTISDIHGHLDKLDELLKFWNPDSQELVFLGDYIDRGPDSLGVLERVFELKRKYGAIVNMGNHEDMFLLWNRYPDDPDDYYYNHVGINTVLSFLKDFPVKKTTSIPHIFTPLQIRNYIRETYPEIIDMMKTMKLFHETEHYVFIHAGFNPHLSNWKNSNPNDYLWIREAFIYNKNNSGKTVVFGHTNTWLLHDDKDNNGIWTDKWNSKIGIDGGAGGGRNLNGVVLDRDGDLAKTIVHQV